MQLRFRIAFLASSDLLTLMPTWIETRDYRCPYMSIVTWSSSCWVLNFELFLPRRSRLVFPGLSSSDNSISSNYSWKAIWHIYIAFVLHVLIKTGAAWHSRYMFDRFCLSVKQVYDDGCNSHNYGRISSTVRSCATRVTDVATTAFLHLRQNKGSINR